MRSPVPGTAKCSAWPASAALFPGAVPNILEQTGLASKVLAIDGCPTACASATLKKAGFSRFTRLQLADLGFNKGSTDPTTENIDRIVTAAKQNLK